MFLFVFENIGTSELIVIGIVALIFLGPRRLPEIARKAGKIMADFRSATSDFKSTWEREVNFDEEARLLRQAGADEAQELKLPTVAQSSAESDARARDLAEPADERPVAAVPAIRSIDREAFENLAPDATDESRRPAADTENGAGGAATDKRSWL